MVQWAVVGAYVLAIFLFSRHDVSGAGYTAQLLARWFPHLKGAELRYYVLVVRKVGHVLAYGLLTFLVYQAARRTEKLRGRALLISVLSALAVAAADESYQRRLMHRSGVWKDVLIDFLGIAAVGMGLWLRARFRSKDKEVSEADGENEHI